MNGYKNDLSVGLALDVRAFLAWCCGAAGLWDVLTVRLQ